MPESRLTKARATLPGDYQFGDARWFSRSALERENARLVYLDALRWRNYAQNAAARLFQWNTIEGD